MVNAPETNWRQLDIAIAGGGISGFAAAVALRRAGHKVTVYERYDYAGEVGASISCAMNGTQWLEEWKVDTAAMRPVILQELVMHHWETGKVINYYDLQDYKDKWGYVYNMFHRQDMHTILMETALSKEGDGIPAVLYTEHRVRAVDSDAGTITFENGKTVKHDMIIGSDGIRSAVRPCIGIEAKVEPAPLAAYRANIAAKTCEELGLENLTSNNGIDYWGGFKEGDRSQYFKIVLSGCRSGEILSFYLFMPQHMSPQRKEGFRFEEVDVEEIAKPFRDAGLDKRVVDLIEHSFDRMPWRLYLHEEYPYWSKGVATLTGDAAHPMLPNQSQGAVQAIEDAAALAIIFSKDHGYTNNIPAGLKLYEKVRKPRATRVQAA